MITIRIPQRVLHVPDERVVPVDEPERTIGPDLDITWAEHRIIGNEQILLETALDAGAHIGKIMLPDPPQRDDVGQQVITLQVIAEASHLGVIEQPAAYADAITGFIAAL